MASFLPSSWLAVNATAAGTARAAAASAAVVALLSMAVVAAAWLVAFVRRFRHMSRVLEPVPSPPAPTKGALAWIHWALGPVVPLFLGTPWDVMRDWLLASMPVVHLRIGFRHVVLVGDAAGMKRIFQTKQRAYEKDIGFSFSPFMPILGTGLVTADGELWRTQRLLLGPALRTEMLDEVVVISKAAVDRLSRKLAALKGTGRPVDMAEELRMLTLQVIGEAILSLPPEECDKVFPSIYLPIMTEANLRVLQPWRCYLPVLPAWWAFSSRMRRLNTYIIGVLRQRWQARQAGQSSGQPDMLDRIFAGIEERGQKWSTELEVQLCYEVKTFLLAGHETSAAMLTWTLYQLTQHPDCLANVIEEAVRVFGTAERLPQREAVDGMNYTVSCLKETLRRYSVVPVVARHLTADDQIGGYDIPAGSTVIAHIEAVHNDGWKQPARWRPDRFMPGGEYDQFDEDLRLFRFVPFIQGPRNCLGQFFALLEGRVVLALLVKRFKFRLWRQDGADKPLPKVIPTIPLHGLRVLVD